jgi:hypothetical protein
MSGEGMNKQEIAHTIRAALAAYENGELDLAKIILEGLPHIPAPTDETIGADIRLNMESPTRAAPDWVALALDRLDWLRGKDIIAPVPVGVALRSALNCLQR